MATYLINSITQLATGLQFNVTIDSSFTTDVLIPYAKVKPLLDSVKSKAEAQVAPAGVVNSVIGLTFTLEGTHAGDYTVDTSVKNEDVVDIQATEPTEPYIIDIEINYESLAYAAKNDTLEELLILKGTPLAA